jgi:hypothetical protein
MVSTFEMCELETTLIDEECLVDVKVEMLELNLTQSSKHKEESTLKVVCPKMDRSVWDHPPPPLNVNTLTIYLEFVPIFQDHPGRFVECLAKNDNVHLFLRTWVISDGHYRWFKNLINNLPMEQQVDYVTCTIHTILDSL